MGDMYHIAVNILFCT